MTPDHFREAIILTVEVFEKSMNEEIQALIEIIDPKNTKVKTYPGQKEIGLKLVSHYQVYSNIKKIEDEVLDLIM